jgi:outer membrane cobalamin receptor
MSRARPRRTRALARTARRGAALAATTGWFAVSGLASPATAQSARDPVALDTLAVSVGSNLGLANAPRAVEVITAEELADLPVTSVEAALRWTGSVDLLTRSPAQADVSIRGGSFEQVLVLVDGMRVSDPQTGHFDLDLTIPIEQVERIEVLRGAASTAHGADAFGGVINIVTKTPRTTQAQLRLEGGTFGALAGAASFETRTAAGVGFSAGFTRDRGDGHRDGTDYEIWRVRSRLTAPLGAGTLTADAGWAARDFGAQGFYAVFDSFEETRTLHGAVRWSADLGAWSVTPRVAYRKHDDTFILFRDDPPRFTNVHDSRQTMADVTARREIASGVRLAFGSEVALETVESNNLGDRDETRYGVFGEVGVERGAFDVVGGVRFDDRENFDAFVSPSLAIGVQAADGVRFRTSASRAFRTPTWTDRFYSDPANRGSPDLLVETGWSVEVGADVDLPTFGSAAALGDDGLPAQDRRPDRLRPPRGFGGRGPLGRPQRRARRLHRARSGRRGRPGRSARAQLHRVLARSDDRGRRRLRLEDGAPAPRSTALARGRPPDRRSGLRRRPRDEPRPPRSARRHPPSTSASAPRWGDRPSSSTASTSPMRSSWTSPGFPRRGAAVRVGIRTRLGG